MSDEKRTINVDGLSDASIEAIQKGVDVCRSGKGVLMMENETYNESMNKSFNRGLFVAFIAMSIASACFAVYVANEDKMAFIAMSIASACLAVYAANEDKIKDGFAKAMKFIFGKKK